MTNPTFQPSHRKPLFDALTDLAKEMKCYGPQKGSPALPSSPSGTLSLNKILRIQMMFADVERMRLTLELGANPKYRDKVRHYSPLQVAHAYAKLYGDNQMIDLLKEYGATVAPKKNRNKKS
ncbi:MAG: hypothetical protein JSR17_00225 [Proteobacteria bacterium]|nr:hypothetical protein [Pseudomonadota bacterium]